MTAPTVGKTTQLLTCDEVAASLKCKPITVQQWCRDGDLRASQVARRWLIHPDDLQTFLEERSNRPRLHTVRGARGRRRTA